MKPLILTAMTVIGLFGIIGTIEYAQAQTILTIPPTNLPEATQGTFNIRAESPDNTWINLYNKTFNNIAEPYIGNFHVQKDTLLKPDTLFSTTIKPDQCIVDIRNIKLLLRETAGRIPNLTTPSNIPENNDNITAMGLDFKGNTDRDSKCTPDLEATSKYPLFTTKELRWTLYNQSDKKAYHFSPRENITEAQPIPLCTTDNLNAADQTLKGDTKMCYGKHGNNMIIITKKLTGIYGATETITTPKEPIALDSNVVETVKTVKEREQREKTYVELLKRLYLPPI